MLCTILNSSERGKLDRCYVQIRLHKISYTFSCTSTKDTSYRRMHRGLSHFPMVYLLTKDIVESKICVIFSHLNRHETLTIIKEFHIKVGFFNITSPCL